MPTVMRADRRRRQYHDYRTDPVLPPNPRLSEATWATCHHLRDQRIGERTANPLPSLPEPDHLAPSACTFTVTELVLLLILPMFVSVYTCLFCDRRFRRRDDDREEPTRCRHNPGRPQMEERTALW